MKTHFTNQRLDQWWAPFTRCGLIATTVQTARRWAKVTCKNCLRSAEGRIVTLSWKLGQYVRIWRNEGYVYGHIETIEGWGSIDDEVMLVGDDGQEIYTTVKELENGD